MRWPVSMPEADQLLLEQYIDRRDPAAFTKIVGRHNDSVFQTCRRVLGDRAQAQLARQTGVPPPTLSRRMNEAGAALRRELCRREGTLSGLLMVASGLLAFAVAMGLAVRPSGGRVTAMAPQPQPEPPKAPATM